MRDPGRAIPKIVASIDVLSLPIGSVEGYVLSRIDGRVSLDELVDLVGLPTAEVEGAIDRLAELGAIVLEEPAAGSSTISTRIQRSSAPPQLEEVVDLSPERCKAVLEMATRLDRLTHYELLGIRDTADKSEVRNAYFTLSKLVHPDTLYGKQLGSYKSKMEAIFKRATEAYDILSKRKRREEYDAALGLPPLAERLAKLPPAMESPVTTEPPGPDEPKGPISSVTLVGDRPNTPPPRPPAVPRVTSASRDESVRTQAQRRVLRQIAQMAGRSTASAARPPRPASDPPSSGAPASGPASSPCGALPGSGDPSSPRSNVAPSSRDPLLRDLASSLRGVHRFTTPDRLDKHLRLAREAEQAGDLVGAANALRFAQELSPDREDIGIEYRRVRFALAKLQADNFEKQALREERMELWSAAAISWSRVAEGRPEDGAVHRRAAFCLWKSDGDLKRARDLALRAVELLSGDVEARITLCRIYLSAGMKLNARREIEAVAKLDPKHEMVKNLLRELKS